MCPIEPWVLYKALTASLPQPGVPGCREQQHQVDQPSASQDFHAVCLSCHTCHYWILAPVATLISSQHYQTKPGVPQDLGEENLLLLAGVWLKGSELSKVCKVPSPIFSRGKSKTSLAQLAGCLLNCRRPGVRPPAPNKPVEVVHTCNLCTCED